MAKQPGLDSRHRNNGGETRGKNGNTKVGTLRDTYGASFAKGTRSDAHLKTVLSKTGTASLSAYLKKH